MRIFSLALFAFALALSAATAAHGTEARDLELAAKLTADLLPLQSALVGTEPLEDRVYSREELQSLITSSQSRVIQAFQRDLRSFEAVATRLAMRDFGELPPVFQTFASPDQAYKLTHALAGKDLSEASLKPLAQGIVGMLNGALACRVSGAPLRDSAALRDAGQQAYDALKKLGVSDRDIGVVIDAFLRGAETLSRPAPVIFK